MKNVIVLILLFGFLHSCKERPSDETAEERPSSLVFISVNFPDQRFHLVKQDSIGKELADSIGPKAFHTRPGFRYVDHLNIEKIWLPKTNKRDTLEIKWFSKYFELSTSNFYTAINHSFLLQAGDTVMIDYKFNIPHLKVINRPVNDTELNYNSYRHLNLFKNKYTSHLLVSSSFYYDEDILNYEKNCVHYYKTAVNDYNRELKLLDSLRNVKIMTLEGYNYRKNILDMLMKSHKKNKIISEYLRTNQETNSLLVYEGKNYFDLAKADSLIKFEYFRQFLKDISVYGLEWMKKNEQGSGGFYIDSRTRFDSIVGDKRFNQAAKDYLLMDSYAAICENFTFEEKERYFNKLQEHLSNKDLLQELEKDLKLYFDKSAELILSDVKNDTLTFNDLLNSNRGKWLYVDFWASWCKPCRETMPSSLKLKDELKNYNLEFVYLSLNDKRENWLKALKADNISATHNYFIENGKLSRVIDDLGIQTIPRYLIFDPEGILINGNAKQPGKGAKEQLIKLVAKK
jgi:thiol-disulfide isomerase/thioredoxin